MLKVTAESRSVMVAVWRPPWPATSVAVPFDTVGARSASQRWSSLFVDHAVVCRRRRERQARWRRRP